VVETVKKLNWSPDIIHVHGWMASLLPLYLREYYADEPLFADSKIVTSIYNKSFEGELDSEMINKIAFDGIKKEQISSLAKPDYNNLLKVAADYSDAIILAAEEVSEDLKSHIDNLSKPVLPYVSLQEAEEAYTNFYNTEVLK
jgi:starch synthase